MVAKINNGSSIYGALSYNQDKVNEGYAEVIFSNRIIQNLSQNKEINMYLAMRSFEPYILANKRTEKPVVHISLNPSLNDNLSDKKLGQIARDYMDKMGFGDQPFIVYKHSDIDRSHIHVVTVRVDETGKKISDSYEKLRSMDACRELEIKYGLERMNRKDENKKYYLRKVEYERGDVKQQISNTIRSLIEDYKFQTMGEFNALLSCYNIHSNYVKGEEAGNIYHGIIYSATNDSGDVVSSPIKSSRIGKFAGYEAMAKKMENATIDNKKYSPVYPKKLIAGLMRITSDKEFFIRKMKENHIDVIFRNNDEGRIYGVTFVDHQSKMVYNGFRLGKEFSANIFNERFNKENKLSNENLNPSFPELKHEPESNDNVFYAPTSLDEIFGEFYLDYRSFDPEEEMFQRKMKRKSQIKYK